MSSLSSTQGTTRSRAGVVTLAVALCASAVALAPVAPVAQAQEPGQVTGLQVVQDDGFATVSWNPVAEATRYEVERTPVDAANEPIGPERIVGLWEPTRTVRPDAPTFADSGFVLGERFRWRVRGLVGELPYRVTVDPPSSAAGTYEANGASFGPAPDQTGLAGDIVLVNDGSADPTQGCSPLVDFPAGAIALVDRGGCTFVLKVNNAQDAGATAVIVANNTGGTPINLGGTDPGIVIPAVHVSQDDGNTIKAGLPATGRVHSAPQLPFSEPVFGTTLPQFGDPSEPGESLRTQFELTNGAQFTTDVNEFAYTAALDEASDRVRVVEIGRTLRGRPINMFVIGYPKPRPTAAAISEHPSVLVQCHVHGNEPSMRESCLILARELAFTDDQEMLDILSQTTVLLVVTLNGDGRAANTRGSSTGQDLNRDHSLLREPETKAFSAMLRDYTPDIGVDGHNGDSEDLPVLGSRHLNVFEGMYAEAKNGLIEGWLYDGGARSGWYVGPYSNGGASQETILRNTMGLKNIFGLLSENRGAAGPTRPNATAAENQNRRTYGQLWLAKEVLEYHRDNLPVIQDAIEDSISFQTANQGPIVFRGSYPWPVFPPLPSAPAVDAPDPDAILENPPCGYFLTEEQYAGEHPDGTVAERLALHGIDVVRAPARDDLGSGYLVLMAQPLRGLIPLLLDGQAAEPMVDGVRLFPPMGPGGEPLPGAACGRGPAVPTADIAVDHDLDYQTDE
ncbi:MAG TPA: PA domain-containing protein [Jiangellaceae bacterium]